MLTAAAALPLDDEAAAMEDEPPAALLMLIAGLQSACFGCIGTALPSAMSDAGLSPANVALLLGRIGSASAFAEVLLSASFGKLADAIGRKPILLGAPLVTVLARSFVVVHPSLNVLVGARLITTLAVPMYWLAYQASMADVFGRNSTRLAILGSRVQAGMGLGYAISSFVGGALAARDIRLAYAASCTLGCCVIASVSLGLRETLAKERRRPFAWKGTSPLAFTRLFGRGALSAKLNAVVLLQSLTNGMGDLWQVLARELRGWGASQCGNFAAIAGLATMGGTLLTGPSIRRFGARGHTVASTMSSAVASVVLGHATSNAIAFSGVVPMALGAGKSQATSARITNLGEELGIPQGQLAAERNTLNAFI
jgi:DHA1 family tetracycline resistance protein-like MFS transporter